MKTKTSLLLGLAASAMLAGVLQVGTALADTTINALFMKQAAYSEDDVRSMAKDFETANPGIKVNLEFVPYEGLHDKIVAGSGAQGYDVVLFDVIWPAEFAKHGILMDVTSRISPDDTAKVFDGAWSTVTYEGKRYGMPWILDTKYLFYNKEMLEKAGIANPPKTWDELVADAKVLKEKGISKYPIVWSWAQAEAVICDYTTLVDAYGGKFFDDAGKPAIDQDGALDAMKFMEQTLKDGITNPNSKEYLEEDVRKVFSNGDAAFALNWTYMYNMANGDPKESKIVGKVGVVPAPGIAGKSEFSAVNGSMGLGIAAKSAHPDEAWKFIAFLTSQPEQNKFAKLSLPIWKSSYDDPAVQQGQEALVAAAKGAINAMYPRPTTPSYQEMSTILQKYIQQVVIGQSSSEDAMAAAAKQVARLR
ncbi:MAG TPA: ABC transporter substrate-binding protein [Dongiaceae bacterium]|nr:ABC transporter substrate-binding protein [Dongiaceae bacterium]